MREIIISPDKILFGEKTSIMLKGFDANQEVKLEARCKVRDKVYVSNAIFRTDKDGSIDLTKDTPLSGSYHGVEPMGLIVSMEEESKQEKFTYVKEDLNPNITEFTGIIDDKKVASATLEQAVLADDVVQETLADKRLNGTLFIPKNVHDTLVICLSGSDGGEPKSMASMFASNGFMALTLAYFNHDGLPKALSEIPLEYFEKAFDFLKHDARTKNRKISIVGGSKGAELALLLSSRYPCVQSVVAYAPSHVVWSGFGDFKQMKSSSWSYDKKGLAFVQVKSKFMTILKYLFSKKPLEFTSTYLHSLAADVNQDAIIKVENIQGDILLISGEDDKMWCSSLMANKIMQRLKEHNFSYSYTHLSYQGAGHMITTPYFPSKYKDYYHPFDKKIYSLGGDMYADLKASIDSWQKVLEFLKR